jgi:galactonate dehydratase
MSCPNVIVQETNRAYYRGWYDKFVEPNLDIRDGYLYATEEPGLGTRLKAEVFDRPDVHVEVTDEARDWNWAGFVDPGQKIAHYYQPKVPGRQA